MKAMLAYGFAHATLMSPPFTQFLIFELRFAIGPADTLREIAKRKSKIKNE
jgi:hypothetical protein